MKLGNVVEFIDSQKIICAAVTDIKKLRLRLLTEHNREVKISAGRLSHTSDLHLNLDMGRDKTVALLKETAARRRELSHAIDIIAIWDVLNTEQEQIDLSTMTSFCFPDDKTSDHESAVVRAFFQDRFYFKFSPQGFLPRTKAKVESIISQREADIKKESQITEGAQWMRKVLAGQPVTVPQNGEAIVEILSAYYLHEKESPQREQAKAILKKIDNGSIGKIFTFLVRIGHWDSHENLDLLRYDIPMELPKSIEANAAELSRNVALVANGRRDLRDTPVLTIDGPSTLDFDDALSITKQDSHYELGVHIADVGYYVAKNDPIDAHSRIRGSSIYLPECKISMMPAVLSENLCSLKAGQDKPAISTLIRITPQAEILGFEIIPSIIRIDRQLTFQDADLLVNEDDTIKTMHTIATSYRQRRLDDGAMIIDLPETSVWLDPAGKPTIKIADREAPGRLLVAELMILANAMAARLLEDRHLPAIFRSQPEPRERLFAHGQGSLFQNWMQRKQIHRFVLSNMPEPHSGLGLASYVTATSPIRKYFDLVTQRQLRAAAGMESPYSQGQIDAIIADLADPMAQVGLIQRNRHRYWLLKYLEGRIGKKEEGIILSKRRNYYSILLKEYMLECPLQGADSIKLRPEDLVQVTIQHANARNDLLTVYLG